MKQWRTPALRLAVAGVGLVVLGLVGCGKSPPTPMETVTGTVTIKGGDVSKLEESFVQLESTDGKTTSVGRINEGGTFGMTTFADNQYWPGVPAGDYKVRIQLADETAKSPIHKKHLDYKTSGLTFTVAKGKNDLPITLEPPPRVE